MQDVHYFDPYHIPRTASPTYNIFPDSQGGGDTVLEALAYCVFPSAWQKNEAISLFLQNPCLRISVWPQCTGKPIFQQQKQCSVETCWILRGKCPHRSLAFLPVFRAVTGSLCSELSLQEHLYSKQPWKIDVVFLSGASDRHVYCPFSCP